jgi:hypothetical protein
MVIRAVPGERLHLIQYELLHVAPLCGSSDDAHMALVLNNAKGELTPLQIGSRSWRYRKRNHFERKRTCTSRQHCAVINV